MHTALEMAKYVINKCISLERPVSNLQLQKILYYIQGEYMKSMQGQELFEDDIYAWQYGPVVPDVYYTFNVYSSSSITFKQDEIELTAEERKIIDPVINSKSNLSAWQLVRDTHSEDPWKESYTDNSKNVIGKDSLRRWFIK